MRTVLTVEAGEGDPRVCRLISGATVTLGRHRDNLIVLRDEHVSRRHAELYQEDGYWLIRDSGGRNGTLVDGTRIAGPTVLRNGQIITIGKTTLRFTQEPGENGTIELDHKSDRSDTSSGSSLTNLDQGLLRHDELTALCQFMTENAKQTDPGSLIRNALQIMSRQTSASVTGFLSLDPGIPLPRIVVPETAQVDVPLSRQLTQIVHNTERAVWLASERDADIESESLTSYADAICIPLQVGEMRVGAVHVYKAGVFFTNRDVRFCEILSRHLANCLHILRIRRSLEAENSRLRRHVTAADDLVGESQAMQQLREKASLLAACPSPVLIVGESGVGKELVATAVHRISRRREGPLVTVNCAALTAELADSELFGHCRGSFTGAERDHPGLFQQADEGTLFLDEIGELAPEIQAKLLRVVEGRKIRSVGATTDTQVDVRIVAATNRNLEREVEAGRFRRDLYFRLQGLQIDVPPLREHREDIPELVRYFLGKTREEWGRQVSLTEAAINRLMDYHWPGNVRQLRFVLESAVALQQTNIVDAGDLSLPAGPAGPRLADEPIFNLEEIEARTIRRALASTGGNITQAAKMLGIVRDTLTNKMRKYGIEK
jgi:transcriptional regulator with GAF, ATPase, and Fis domain